MIILTIVRHGESTDNLKPIWAGWADAPLSQHGMNQAQALGKSLASYKVDAIFASTLLRATWTAQQIHRNQDPQPPLTLTPLLREQHFGEAEREGFASEKGSGYFREPGRNFKFPGGESLEDVRRRAEEGIAQFIEPILKQSRGKSAEEAPHIFVVAHGIFNSEFLGALMARRAPVADQIEWRAGSMTNTGWHRLELGYADELSPKKESTTIEFGDDKASSGGPSSTASSPPDLQRQYKSASGKPLEYVTVRVVATNVATHLEGVVRQKGGIGSSAFDEKQRSIRSFFGGGGNVSG